MPSNITRDRFDDVPRDKGRVGAHRAEHPSMRGWTTLLWASVAAVVLFAAGVFGTLVAMGRITFGEETATQPTSSAGTPVEARVDTSYTILVMNATEDPAKTEQVTQLLLAAGWAQEQIFALESEQKDFAETTIYYSLPGDLAPAMGLADIVSAQHTDQSDTYQMGDIDESPQLTIVVGADFGSEG